VLRAGTVVGRSGGAAVVECGRTSSDANLGRVIDKQRGVPVRGINFVVASPSSIRANPLVQISAVLSTLQSARRGYVHPYTDNGHALVHTQLPQPKHPSGLVNCSQLLPTITRSRLIQATTKRNIDPAVRKYPPLLQ
jgi:hypothetical protein